MPSRLATPLLIALVASAFSTSCAKAPDDSIGQHVLDLPKDMQAITIHQLLTHTTIGASRAYGYGWQIIKTARGTGAQVHTGADEGVGHFAALYRFVDEEVIVILLSNSSESIAVATLRGLLAKAFPGQG